MIASVTTVYHGHAYSILYSLLVFVFVFVFVHIRAKVSEKTQVVRCLHYILFYSTVSQLQCWSTLFQAIRQRCTTSSVNDIIA